MLRVERSALNSDSLSGMPRGSSRITGAQSAPLTIHELSSEWTKVYCAIRNGMR
jgi:hypothetical protein